MPSRGIAPRAHASAHRRGFSLFELLIVIAIATAISAMAAPQLMSLMREGTVFEAGDKIRDAMSEARRFAIDTGIDYEFRYEVNGHMAVILPAELERDVSEQGTSKTTEEYFRMLVELSEDLTLRAAEGVEESSERLDPVAFGNLTGTQLSQRSWSKPLLFRFDGTSDDFELRVSDKEGLTSLIEVRGLTGAVRTGQVYTEDN